MPQNEDKSSKSYTLSGKNAKERGITFSLEKQPTINAQKSWHSLSQGSKKKTLLGAADATAICGNDITSSCLYVAALSAAHSGYLAPISLLTVAFVLYLYRNIYAEIGEALPLNGGAYNCLLNTTTKAKASVAACMTFLSYVATAVISAYTSIHYLNVVTVQIPSIGHLPEIPATICLLSIFAILVVSGIRESAKAALGIFSIHITCLSVLCLGGLVYIISNPSVLVNNWGVIPQGRSVPEALFFGFAVALLGISGFESSANFIEEQKEGVFPKTLRNMWATITVFNPLIALIAIGVLPLQQIIDGQKSLLADVATNLTGHSIGGGIMALNAAFVLSGAVLASFIGVTGLVNRMTLDRCLPQALNKMNKRGSYHRIVFMFLLLCISILVLSEGDTSILAGVYTISFLGVMCLFALGNILLKLRRARLPRKTRASWASLILAITATVCGILGNIILDSNKFIFFGLYFFPTVAFVLLTLYRQHLLKVFLIVVDDMMTSFSNTHARLRKIVTKKILEIKSKGLIFFTKGDNVASLNRALLYIRENESATSVTIIHILDGTEIPPPRLVSDLRLLDEIYPDLKIELVLRKGKFGPELIKNLAKEYGVPPNYMFLGTPGDHFPHSLSELGGVRVII